MTTPSFGGGEFEQVGYAFDAVDDGVVGEIRVTDVHAIYQAVDADREADGYAAFQILPTVWAALVDG